MAKKDRTGLQSKVSHIFAGVPIPKRKPPRSEHPDKKPESHEPEQTAPTEKLPPEKSSVQEIPEKQPLQPEVPAEETPVVESPVVESSASKGSTEQEQIKETPVEKMIAPQSQVEKIPIEQPPVIEPQVQPSAPFSQAIEIPEFEETIDTLPDLSSVRPVKGSVIEQGTVKIPHKIPVISKGKRITSNKSGVSSRRQTTMVILVIALSILLFFLLVKPFSQPSSNSARSQANISTGSPLSIVANGKSVVINWSAPPEYPTEIRDPMLPVSDQQLYSETGMPVISGISSSREGENVVIMKGTGKLVKEGEEIFGWKVLKINPNSVIFEKDGKTLELEPQGK